MLNNTDKEDCCYDCYTVTTECYGDHTGCHDHPDEPFHNIVVFCPKHRKIINGEFNGWSQEFMNDPFKPSIGLLVKLGSLIVHMEEHQSEKGHPFDAIAVKNLLCDPDITEWFKAMNGRAMLPVKR